MQCTWNFTLFRNGPLFFWASFFLPSGCARFFSWAASLFKNFFKHQKLQWFPLHDFFSSFFLCSKVSLEIAHPSPPPHKNNGPFFKSDNQAHNKTQKLKGQNIARIRGGSRIFLRMGRTTKEWRKCLFFSEYQLYCEAAVNLGGGGRGVVVAHPLHTLPRSAPEDVYLTIKHGKSSLYIFRQYIALIELKSVAVVRYFYL